ncbi:hypothetical protein CIG75_05275 [Tumebacillus algifaecis]|uniref:Uncharacterized protein n=1 Tax=Tumebacillus algifaecis TaxID=1214604 RepID=A0A223CYN2_9BACL|nr:hypothetical protein [Tumebacillus algifaecis]ASS74458.1 hypothetical protein CIG75_05275 [Tumebacillus algifaecis]
MKNALQKEPIYQSVRVDDGPKLVLVDRGRILDELKLGEFDTRTVKTHHGQILSCVMEATTYYREKK